MTFYVSACIEGFDVMNESGCAGNCDFMFNAVEYKDGKSTRLSLSNIYTL